MLHVYGSYLMEKGLCIADEYCLRNDSNVSIYTRGSDLKKDERPPQFSFGILEALGHKVHGLIRLVLVWLDCCLSWVEWFVLGLIRKGVLEKDTIRYPDVYERSLEA